MLRHVHRGPIALLKGLYDLANRGEIVGVAICYRMRDGTEVTEFTGIYKDQPACAVAGTMRLSWELTKAQDAMRGPP
jgi:hypothetical protein